MTPVFECLTQSGVHGCREVSVLRTGATAHGGGVAVAHAVASAGRSRSSKASCFVPGAAMSGRVKHRGRRFDGCSLGAREQRARRVGARPSCVGSAGAKRLAVGSITAQRTNARAATSNVGAIWAII